MVSLWKNSVLLLIADHADLIPSTVGLRIFQLMPWRVRLQALGKACTGKGDNLKRLLLHKHSQLDVSLFKPHIALRGVAN